MEISVLINAILGVLTLVAGGGWLFDKQKHRREMSQRDMDLSKLYVDEFRKNIVEPLQSEVNDLRNEIKILTNALDKIPDCTHSANCPVYYELRRQQNITEE